MGLFNIWVTHSCNLSCSYCYESEIRKEMNFDQSLFDDLIKFIVETSQSWEEVIINFHGGEPLINFNFIKKLVYKLESFNLNCYYSFTTNAMLLNSSIIRFCKKYNISLSISIDGNRVSNDINRRDKKGNSTYDIVVRKILLCIQNGIEPRIRMTVEPENIRYLSQGVESLWNMGCKTLVAAPDLLCSQWSKKDISLLSMELQKIKKLINHDQNAFHFFDCVPNRKKGKCCGGIYEHNISPAGDLYPCTFVYGKREYCIGNIKTGIDMIKLNNLKSIYLEPNYNCRECKYLDFCIANRCKYLNVGVGRNLLEAPKLVCDLVNLVKEVKK